MDFLISGISKAIALIFSFDIELLKIVLVSVKVSGIAIIFATLTGVPIGIFTGLYDFPGKRIVIVMFNTLMGVPTVFVGLLGYSFLTRNGLLGELQLLYTPWGMIIGQFILAVPIIISLTITAVKNVDLRIQREVMGMGGEMKDVFWAIIKEGRYGIISALITAFGRIFAEVGVAMMIGGNIKGFTRNITTAIVLETGKGNYELGVALGLILIFVSFTLYFIVSKIQGVHGKV